jgi:hypothetical protein
MRLQLKVLLSNVGLHPDNLLFEPRSLIISLLPPPLLSPKYVDVPVELLDDLLHLFPILHLLVQIPQQLVRLVLLPVQLFN